MAKSEYWPRFFAVNKVLVHAAALLCFRLKTVGRENLPKEGGLMLVSNHASNLDPPIVGCALPRDIYTLAKAELARIPIFGPFLVHACYAIPLRRKGVDREAMKKCVKLMKSGEIVSMFPEGTRTRDGELQRGKPGAAMIALQGGAPCVPAYIDGSFRAWPRARWFPLPRKITIYYGKPFNLPERAEGQSAKEHYQACADEMMRRIAALRPGAKNNK